MKILYITLLTQLLMSCGDRILECGDEVVDNRYYTEHYWDETLVPYVHDYLDMSNSRDIETSGIEQVTRIEYGEIDKENVVGYCSEFHSADGHIYKTITIKKDYSFDEYEMKALMMHELGHCVHNLDHSSRPGNIMYDTLPNEEYLEDSWDDRVEEFFNFLLNGDPISED